MNTKGRKIFNSRSAYASAHHTMYYSFLVHSQLSKFLHNWWIQIQKKYNPISMRFYACLITHHPVKNFCKILIKTFVGFKSLLGKEIFIKVISLHTKKKKQKCEIASRTAIFPSSLSRLLLLSQLMKSFLIH